MAGDIVGNGEERGGLLDSTALTDWDALETEAQMLAGDIKKKSNESKKPGKKPLRAAALPPLPALDKFSPVANTSPLLTDESSDGSKKLAERVLVVSSPEPSPPIRALRLQRTRDDKSSASPDQDPGEEEDKQKRCSQCSCASSTSSAQKTDNAEEKENEGSAGNKGNTAASHPRKILGSHQPHSSPVSSRRRTKPVSSSALRGSSGYNRMSNQPPPSPTPLRKAGNVPAQVQYNFCGL